ncbi:MAG: isoprenylcysteine carboxylmethyltransferase family protein [Candidatus Magasanikbacteria bacterium]|nr:isoprenylcysteine carboxylmethyltransferase family protein [Candidatus Magasanikbacteria bacterium]
MIELFIKTFIAFIFPIPIWLNLLHLAILKKPKLKLVAYFSIGIYWLLLFWLVFFYFTPVFKYTFDKSFWHYLFAIITMIVALTLDILLIKQLGLKRLLTVTEVKQDNEEHELVVQGIYKYARHPRYISIPLWVLGIGLVTGYVIVLWLSLYMFIGLWIATFLEEAELIQRFGQGYINYQKRVPKFFIF